MKDSFDPYYIWLGIKPADQPPTAYRLLGLDAFEGNHDVIENAADRQMAHVRSHQGGKHSESSQKLLNEISSAKVMLLNADTKAKYDGQLRKLLNPERGERAIAPPSQPSGPVDSSQIERPLEKPSAGPSQPAPAQSKPAQSKPARSKPAQSKPAVQTEKSSGSPTQPSSSRGAQANTQPRRGSPSQSVPSASGALPAVPMSLPQLDDIDPLSQNSLGRSAPHLQKPQDAKVKEQTRPEETSATIPLWVALGGGAFLVVVVAFISFALFGGSGATMASNDASRDAKASSTNPSAQSPTGNAEPKDGEQKDASSSTNAAANDDSEAADSNSADSSTADSSTADSAVADSRAADDKPNSTKPSDADPESGEIDKDPPAEDSSRNHSSKPEKTYPGLEADPGAESTGDSPESEGTSSAKAKAEENEQTNRLRILQSQAHFSDQSSVPVAQLLTSFPRVRALPEGWLSDGAATVIQETPITNFVTYTGKEESQTGSIVTPPVSFGDFQLEVLAEAPTAESRLRIELWDDLANPFIGMEISGHGGVHEASGSDDQFPVVTVDGNEKIQKLELRRADHRKVNRYRIVSLNGQRHLIVNNEYVGLFPTGSQPESGRVRIALNGGVRIYGVSHGPTPLPPSKRPRWEELFTRTRAAALPRNWQGYGAIGVANEQRVKVLRPLTINVPAQATGSTSHSDSGDAESSDVEGGFGRSTRHSNIEYVRTPVCDLSEQFTVELRIQIQKKSMFKIVLEGDGISPDFVVRFDRSSDKSCRFGMTGAASQDLSPFPDGVVRLKLQRRGDVFTASFDQGVKQFVFARTPLAESLQFRRISLALSNGGQFARVFGVSVSR